MEKPIVVTLSQHDITALEGLAKGNLSYVIRDMVSDYDLEAVQKRVTTDRKGCRFDLKTQRKLEEDAGRLGTSVSALVRAIVESKLH